VHLVDEGMAWWPRQGLKRMSLPKPFFKFKSFFFGLKICYLPKWGRIPHVNDENKDFVISPEILKIPFYS
jgi:hypothetical protein